MVLCTLQVLCNPEVLFLLTSDKILDLRYPPTQGHHLEDAASSSVRWCFGWAARGVEKLQPEQRELLVSNLSGHGVTLVTRFSGLDAPGCAAKVLSEHLESVNLLPETGGFIVHSACDFDKRSLRCLDALAQEGAMAHIFENIESFVTQPALRKLQQLVNNVDKSTPAATRGEEAQFEYMRELMHPLLEEGGLCSEAPCRVHKHACRLFPHVGESGLVLNVTGTPCVDWSKRGKKQQAMGQTAMCFAIFMSEFIKSGQPLLCHECTPDFPDWALLRPLHFFGKKAWRMEVFRLCPTMLGIPSKRMRRFSVVWDSSKVSFGGTFSDFVNLFVQPAEMPGSIFFRSGEDLGLEASKTKLQSLQMYTDRWRAATAKNPAASSKSLCDLNQRPPYGKLEAVMPTLVTHHSPYCLEKKRLLTADESLEVQLLPVDHPARRLLRAGVLKENHARHLAGNTMNCACVGTMILYILATTRKLDDHSAFAVPSSSRDFD